MDRYTTLPDWPHVLVEKEQVGRLLAAIGFSDSLDPTTPGLLRSRLDYLEHYGASEDGSIRRFQIRLGYDFAPHSFSVLWFRCRELEDGNIETGFAWPGGLICHCSGADPMAVSLVEQAWGIHT